MSSKNVAEQKPFRHSGPLYTQKCFVNFGDFYVVHKKDFTPIVDYLIYFD